MAIRWQRWGTLSRGRRAGRAVGAILFEQLANGAEVYSQWAAEAGGEHGDSILLTLAVSNEHAPAVQFDVLDAEAGTLEQTQAGAIE